MIQVDGRLAGAAVAKLDKSLDAFHDMLTRAHGVFILPQAPGAAFIFGAQ